MSKTSSIYAYLEKPSMVDYPRHFAAVFFTSGCNFTCGFCHNAALMGKKQTGLSWRRLKEACIRFKQDWVNGVVITGGEPTMAGDLPDLIQLFKKQFGFSVKLDTNGSDPDRLAECLPLVDYVAMDIKTTVSGYPELVGYTQADHIRKSIELIKAEARDYEFRTTVIDTIHTDEQMDAIGETIDGAKRYALQAFIPRENLPGQRFSLLPRTPSSRLHELRNRLTHRADEILIRGV
jgi:pyruvate formate lyase activating enzyme